MSEKMKNEHQLQSCKNLTSFEKSQKMQNKTALNRHINIHVRQRPLRT